MATVHPSSVLRSQTDDERRVAMEAFVADLRTLAKKLQGDVRARRTRVAAMNMPPTIAKVRMPTI